jgi:hypothetical protein
MDICIDFDGTCVTHEFPKIGNDVGAIPILKKLVQKNHRLILFTMRSNKNDIPYLDEAVQWFHENEIPLYAIQTNPEQKSWTESPKAYANLFIDDAALGCPLKYDRNLSLRPFVDWEKVEQELIRRNIL